MSFNELNLHENILKAIQACGYNTPTPVQKKSIPPILEGKDVVASAQTGTGKTASFVLPALHRLATKSGPKKTRILILTPTRELAAQITKSAIQYGKFLRFNIVNLVGGMPYHQQIRELSKGADIIVATPGRLLDHIESKRVDLSNVEMLVLDEADRMLDMGFIEDVEYIAKLTPAGRQTLLFSATVDKKLTTVVRHLLTNPVRVDLSNEKITVPQIDQQLYKANNPQHKARLLKHFLNDENIYKAIIFTATKINADKIADKLSDDGFAAAALHGDLRQNVRNRTIDQLRRGKIQFLVATDVAARGIDISDITHVFNYDLPRFCEDYVHRIGRTGRAGKSGVAISFVLPTDTRHVQRIERFIGQRLKLISNLDVGQNETHESRENDREFDEKPRFKKERLSNSEFRGKRFGGKDRDRSERFERSDRPERSGRFERSDRPQRSKSFERSDRPERTNRFERSDRPQRSNRFEKSDRSNKPARFKSIERSDRPSRSRSENKDNVRTEGRQEDSRISYREKSDKPFKKRFEGKNRFSSDKPAGKDGHRPFKKRFANKDRWQNERRAKAE